MRQIDSKFSCDGESIFSSSGAPIPADEPLFLLRARDANAFWALVAYRSACGEDRCVEAHLTGIAEAMNAFRLFARRHPQRMKQPGSSLRKSPGEDLLTPGTGGRP